ncbi:MAG TPA: zf-TFIIB domain-containing protein [Xanthomonadales bacterium]|nr:zf-TFIIB domain-containing protein [Xanthomonadales bacterium]
MAHGSPFRVATIHCPRCRTSELSHGELRHCATCGGSWIPHETLAEHVGTMQVDSNPRLPWAVTTTRLGLPCAVCKHAMEALTLFGVPADRCHSHGAWFDKDQLAEMLHRSAAHVRREDEPGAALAVADVGGEIALTAAVETAPGLLAGVLDVIGGIFSAIDL